MARLDSFLRLVAEQQASDLHFHAGERADRSATTATWCRCPSACSRELETRRFLLEILTPEQRETLEREQQVDFIYVLPEVGRFRANVFVQSRGLGAVFRVIPGTIPTLEELRLPAGACERLAACRTAWCSSPGPPGSGKTHDAGGDGARDQPRPRSATSSRSRTRSSSCTSRSRA